MRTTFQRSILFLNANLESKEHLFMISVINIRESSSLLWKWITNTGLKESRETSSLDHHQLDDWEPTQQIKKMLIFCWILLSFIWSLVVEKWIIFHWIIKHVKLWYFKAFACGETKANWTPLNLSRIALLWGKMDIKYKHVSVVLFFISLVRFFIKTASAASSLFVL